MRIEVLKAWPGRHWRTTLQLADGDTVATALAALGPRDPDIAGCAIFGVRATPTTMLRDGDRLELLRGLQADPKEARRRRAATRPLR